MKKVVHPKIVGIVQARFGSSRLPGKVLLDVAGKPLIQRVLEQASASSLLKELVLATSTDESDTKLARFVTDLGFPVFRGGLQDVLTRFVQTAQMTGGDVIVRLTGDCPLITPDTIDEVVGAFLLADVDYMSNTGPYTRPEGLDVEVFTRAALEAADRETDWKPDREHVTPFIKRCVKFDRRNFRHAGSHAHATAKLSVDTASDLEFVRSIWEKLDGPGPCYYEDVMRALEEASRRSPNVVINKGYYTSVFDAADGIAAKPLPLAESHRLFERASQLIPGGAQTYSKSWKQHVKGVSPVYLARGQGAWVWDVDGTRYVDLIQALLPNILGYAHPAVEDAVAQATKHGCSFSLPHPIQVELAERLVSLIPCAEMVRFAKNGSDATTGAVRIARAFTGKDRVAVCGYHGWHDWYIGTTCRNAGVPEAIAGLSHRFAYNDLDSLEAVLRSHQGEFAAVIMEPVNFYPPKDGFLEGVREMTSRHKAILIFDEMCTGFHFGLGGAQSRFNVTPDLATFGKALGNGHPISCIVGRREVMRELEEVFFSSTFAGEIGAMAAALKVLELLEESEALQVIVDAGTRLLDGVTVFAEHAGLSGRIVPRGYPEWVLLEFLDEDGREDDVLKALWMQEVVRRGVLVLSSHNLCSALDNEAVDHVLRAYAEAFKYIGSLVADGKHLSSYLEGEIPQPAFRLRA